MLTRWDISKQIQITIKGSNFEALKHFETFKFSYSIDWTYKLWMLINLPAFIYRFFNSHYESSKIKKQNTYNSNLLIIIYIF